MVRLEPLADNVLITPDMGQKRTASGIIIPQNARHVANTGTVIASGPKSQCHPGQAIIYTRHSGTEVKSGPNDEPPMVIMPESLILAKIGEAKSCWCNCHGGENGNSERDQASSGSN